MNDHLDDRRLVKQLLAKNKQAFGSFFDGFFPGCTGSRLRGWPTIRMRRKTSFRQR